MNDDRVAALIQTHLVRYPESAIADVYKLLHQATFGPGHAIPSKKSAREWLEHECGLVTPSLAGPLVESVHPDGAIVRLHLRPYLAQQGTIKLLLEALMRSAEQVRGDPALMARRWQQFEAMCRAGEGCADRYAQREAVLFGRARAREGWPAVHHSPAYHSAYHPYYRVLTRAEAEALCRALKAPFEMV